MAGPGAAGSLCARLAAVADHARQLLPAGSSASALAELVDTLSEPRLRIAVGGRINAGKSTLINALVGQEVAATGATECTRLVAWFRAGLQNRVQVRCLDGTAYDVPGLPGGGVPALAALGTPPARIRELVVEVPNDRLDREHTIVDTPGMDSLSGLDDVAMAALARADALLYVMPHPGERDAAALEALRRQATGVYSAANALGVLSRIDELGDGSGDPWPVAERIAATYTERLTGLVAATVPVAGLLAATAAGSSFTEADTALVAHLAGAEPAALTGALYSVHTFRRWRDGPLATSERERLVGLLGRYGIQAALEAYRAGHTSTVALLGALRQRSGVDELAGRIRTQFLEMADRLRAAAGIAAAGRIIATAAAREREVLAALATCLGELRRDHRLRQAELAVTLADLASGRLVLVEPDVAALLALATGDSPAGCVGLPPDASAGEVSDAADREIHRWRKLEEAPSRVVQRHARTAREVCEAIYFATRPGADQP